jgi:alpha-galactosidase
MKPLVAGEWAVCFLNRSRTPRQVSFDWQKENINDTVSKRTLASPDYNLRNLWLKKDAGNTKKPVTASLAAHEVLMYRLTKGKKS